MKKIALMASVVAVALSWTACDNYELPMPQAPVNEQEPLFSTDELTIANQPQGEVINLADYQSEEAMVVIGNYDINNWPAGYDLGMVAQLSATADFASVQSIETTCLDGEIAVPGKALNDAFARLFGKAPVERVAHLRYQVTANRKGQPEYFIGGPDAYFQPYTLTATVYSEYNLADNYYIVVNNQAPVKMNHSDKSPYDDPVFSYLNEDVPNGGYTFYIYAEGNTAVKYYGEKANKGDLVAGDGQTPVTLSDKVLLTINVKDMTYSAVNAYPYLYTPNSFTGTSKPKDSQKLMTTDYTFYQGFAYLKGEMRFSTDRIQTNWAMGSVDDEWKEGTLQASSQHFIPVPEEGLYYVTANIVALTYSLTKIDFVGVLGSATPAQWNENAPVAMSPVDGSNMLKWVATTQFTNGVFKFNMNHGWDINLGGDFANPQLSELIFGGENLPVPMTGDVKVELDLTDIPYSATVSAN